MLIQAIFLAATILPVRDLTRRLRPTPDGLFYEALQVLVALQPVI
jgi:hypothetical protein